MARRKRERGAAAVEGAMTATLFVLIFGGMLSAQAFFRGKIEAMGEARQVAWAQAMNACESGGGDDLLSGAESAPGSEPVNTGLSEASDYNVGVGDLGQDSGYVDITGVKRTVVNKAPIGGGTYSPVGKFYVRCNEPPCSGVCENSMWELIKKAFGVATDGMF